MPDSPPHAQSVETTFARAVLLNTRLGAR